MIPLTQLFLYLSKTASGIAFHQDATPNNGKESNSTSENTYVVSLSLGAAMMFQQASWHGKLKDAMNLGLCLPVWPPHTFTS
jgi:hypothetical protein